MAAPKTLPNLTFGVELEMAVAYLERGVPNPNPKDPRQVEFTAEDEDYDVVKKEVEGRRRLLLPLNITTPEQYHNRAIKWACKRRIRDVLTEAGVPVNQDHTKHPYADGDPTLWEVTDDLSVEFDKYGKYQTWDQVEIRSPAYYYNETSIEMVRKVCTLLEATFVIDTDHGCGLHVHVGKGSTGFDDRLVRDLMSFQWAFEPQFNTIMGQNRVGTTWACSHRDESRYAIKYYQKYRERPLPITGVCHFQEDQDLGWLVKQETKYDGEAKYSTVNFRPLQQWRQRNRFGFGSGGKPTIEFRQHKGTIDADRVVVWIATVVGIVDYCLHAHRQDFIQLLSFVTHEHWQLSGHRKIDAQMQQVHGSVLSEDLFTAYDLLTSMGLYDSAAFYRYRIEQVDREPLRIPLNKDKPELTIPFIDWTYQNDVTLTQEQVDLFEQRRHVFELMRRAPRRLREALEFITDDPFWPPHRVVVDLDTNTDFSPKRPTPPPKRPTSAPSGRLMGHIEEDLLNDGVKLSPTHSETHSETVSETIARAKAAARGSRRGSKAGSTGSGGSGGSVGKVLGSVTSSEADALLTQWGVNKITGSNKGPDKGSNKGSDKGEGVAGRKGSSAGGSVAGSDLGSGGKAPSSKGGSTKGSRGSVAGSGPASSGSPGKAPSSAGGSTSGMRGGGYEDDSDVDDADLASQYAVHSPPNSPGAGSQDGSSKRGSVASGSGSAKSAESADSEGHKLWRMAMDRDEGDVLGLEPDTNERRRRAREARRAKEAALQRLRRHVRGEEVEEDGGDEDSEEERSDSEGEMRGALKKIKPFTLDDYVLVEEKTGEK